MDKDNFVRVNSQPEQRNLLPIILQILLTLYVLAALIYFIIYYFFVEVSALLLVSYPLFVEVYSTLLVTHCKSHVTVHIYPDTPQLFSQS